MCLSDDLVGLTIESGLNHHSARKVYKDERPDVSSTHRRRSYAINRSVRITMLLYAGQHPMWFYNGDGEKLF